MVETILGGGEFRGTLKTQTLKVALGGGERECKCSLIGGAPVFEGDIVLARPLEKQGIVVVKPGARWSNSTIVFEIDPQLPNPQRVEQAMAHWEQHTPIRFAQRTNEKDYVVFRAGDGCSSAVGRMGGVQFITLGAQCTTGNAIHEIGHTVGLWHEQSRADRDQYVQIAFENIIAGLEHNFDQHITDGRDIAAYDFDSIMHYPANAFALDPTKPTIIVPGGQKIGQRERLSEGDIATVNEIYP